MVVELRNAQAEREWKPGDSPVLPPIKLGPDDIMRGGIRGHHAHAIIVDDPDEPPRRSPVAAMMAARRAWAKKHRKPKPFTTEHDEGVHRAISAMQRPGRANEL